MFNCLTGEGYYTLSTLGELWRVEYNRDSVTVRRENRPQYAPRGAGMSSLISKSREPIDANTRDKLISEIQQIHGSKAVKVIG